ncbi:hypothetical protein PSEUDO9AZ_40591 [Pseudomonas sp. 9AZ]|nr:hypothetical protein PSEUDO9AZ_40591 [Pseudomonas sp. 9AZ]
MAQDSRVRVLDRYDVILARVRFLGATMWTDFAATGNTPMACISAQSALNEYSHWFRHQFACLTDTDSHHADSSLCRRPEIASH